MKKFIILLILSTVLTTACDLLQGTAFYRQGKPSNFDGLVLWYRADRGVYKDTGCSKKASDGDYVKCWADQSNKKNNLKYEDTPPFFRSKVKDINHTPSIHFDLSTEIRKLVNRNKIFPKLGTVITVTRTIVNAGTFFQGKFDGEVCDNYLKFFEPGNDFYGVQYNGVLITLNTWQLVGSTSIITLINNGHKFFGYSNGVYFGEQQPNQNQEFCGLTLNPNGGTNFYFSEFISFDRALSDSERKQVEEYLAEKYGVDL